MKKGFTLIEILVVVTIFAVLGILISRSIILSIGGSKKSEAIVQVRDNLDYASGIITRQLRTSLQVSPCTGEQVTTINYLDQVGNAASFACVIPGDGSLGYIASGSAKLTSDQVDVTGCSFVCSPATSTTPTIILYNLQAQSSSATSTQNTQVNIDSQVSLRNF